MDKLAKTGVASAGIAAFLAYLDASFHLSRDFAVISRLNRGKQNWIDAVKNGKGSGFYLFQDAAIKYADEECIWSRDGIYTWRQTYKLVCQYGNYFLSLNVSPGDHVGVYLLNRPEFLFTWLGLLSIGAAPALINSNLASDALLHCVSISRAKILLYDSEQDCQNRIESSESQIISDLGVTMIKLDDDLKVKIAQFSHEPSSRKLHAVLEDRAPLALFYTSGTTGLPKAFSAAMSRQYPSASLKKKTFGQRPGPNGDRTYNCMPLYHGTGGLAAMNDMMSGISIAIGTKFSLRSFWLDCIDSKSTIFIYVGETARYLLSAPPSEHDRKHSIRLMWGNGLRPEVWAAFQKRFGIAEVGEFFASTEGMFTTVNHFKGGLGFGSVGHHGGIQRYMYRKLYVTVKIDPQTGDIWRDSITGFGNRKALEAGGEVLVRMGSETDWPGYWHSKEATNKKLVRDILEKGDLYYRTGDVLRRDADGFWFFMDRLGDTYRWKGENVSTTEVSGVLSEFPLIQESIVYGIALPNYDGRVGCAAVILAPGSHQHIWRELVEFLMAKLPRYAIPVFIRVLDVQVGEMSTDNNKQSKVDLQYEGADPSLHGSKVRAKSREFRWLPPGGDCYVPFEPEEWQRLRTGNVKL